MTVEAIRHFNGCAQEIGSMRRGFSEREEYERFARRLGEGKALLAKEVLDVGCGTGSFLENCHHMGLGVAGVDGAKAMLEKAAEKISSDAVRRVDLSSKNLRLPYPRDRFGLVVSTATLIYVPDAERSIREMIRVAQPGGRIVFDVYHKTGRGGVLPTFLKSAYTNSDVHAYGVDIVKLTDELRGEGLISSVKQKKIESPVGRSARDFRVMMLRKAGQPNVICL